jgi:hypothetical protein
MENFMSLTPQAPKKSEDIAFSIVTFPFVALEAVGSGIAAAFTGKFKRQPQEQHAAPADERIPDITANPQYSVADRVCSADVRGRRVSFYQYHAAKVIRITCRELRHLKPIDFTPAIAEGAAVVYDIDGAIEWVRQNGLESEAVKRTAAKAPQRPVSGSGQTQSPPWDVDEKPAKAKPATSAASTEMLNIVPAAGNKSAPFTGRIVSFGITKRTGVGDKKPYTTYAMKLRSESGTYEKEFIGEHLSDLVTEMSLVEGQLVRLQLLGKHHFEVEVDGRMQPRSRNHFAIETL